MQRLKVLLADDHLLFRKGLVSLLSYREDIEIVGEASDGLEAIEIIRQRLHRGSKVDAVILDLTIPGGLGGQKTIVELRKLDPDIRAVVTSGYTDDSVMSDFKDYGFDNFIVKPFRMERLSYILHKLIPKEKMST